MSPEFLFVESVAVRISKKKDLEGEPSLNKTEKIIVDIWDAVGLIGNGGIQYWLLSSVSRKSIVEQLREIECEYLSEVMENVFSILPGIDSIEPVSCKEEKIAKHENRLAELTRMWNDNSEILPSKLENYIKRNWHDINETIIDHYAFWL